MIKVSTLKKNSKNPRQIKGEKLELLKKSVTEFDKMMSLRPMIVDENNIVLGGNMRLAAIKALGMKEIPDEWVKRADDLTEDEKAEFIIKDNAGFGEWDWDAVANEWSDYPLNDWGLDVPGLVNDVEAEWQGMPEFENEDVGAAKSIIVHLTSISDIAGFSKAMGQPVTESTKSLWFPVKKNADLKAVKWVSE